MKTGRKRAFDKNEALDKAMRLFWANGYTGTSISDLTENLGINKPSLYAAFGNKEMLFKASLDHYIACYGKPLLDQLYEPADASLEERLKAYMFSVTKLVTDPGSPRGCLLVKSTCESGSEAVPANITRLVNSIKGDNERTLVAFFTKEQKQGSLSPDTDVEQLASYIMAVLYGIGVLAKNAASMESLQPIIELAVKAILVNKSSSK